MIVSMPYGEIVLPTADAVTLMKILEKAEKYRTKYNGADGATYHIYNAGEQMTAKLINQETYAMYKLAGKPED